MIKFEFKDYVEPKYKKIGDFSEGLAPVQNQKHLWGYIDKTGKEVISCRFDSAECFSEGLAAVKNQEGLWGYIDKMGIPKIPFQFQSASYFREGLAAVQVGNGYYGYINSSGKCAIYPEFKEAFDFREGFAVVKHPTNYMSHIDLNGHDYGHYKWVGPFNEGIGLVDDGIDIYTVNTEYKKLKKLKLKWNGLGTPNCGMVPIKQLDTEKKERYGYLSLDLKLKIPCMYESVRDFCDDVAIVEFDKDVIGFITKEGRNTAFSRKFQYQFIYNFSEGLAFVRTPKDLGGLAGYIDKTGKEVIPCKYWTAGEFHEGLAAVMTPDKEQLYINKKGVKKIKIDNIYTSTLDLGEKVIYIEATSEKELNEKKLSVLAQVKESLIKNITENINDASCEVLDEMYKKPKTKAKK